MAPEKRETTVIIAGSGLTGLTLALILQDLGIPYLLLEAYDNCTPNVGASIAIQPQGLRIFHQLGILEDIEAIYQPVESLTSVDAESGKSHVIKTAAILKERHGYEIGFFNRHDLLCILYKHIREKECLLVNQRVVRIDAHEDRVVVHTSAENVFEAQIIVGADGVRSTVRKEMWRNAEAAGDTIPEEDKRDIICDWAVCYGISEYRPSLPRGQVSSVVGDEYNAGWMVGKDGRCFTFWSFKLPKETRKITYNSIPRFTRDDHDKAIACGKELLAKVPSNDLQIDFNQLYDQRDPVHSGITALPYFVLKKWHYGRIVVIGDSAHKFNPLPGQGGMNCLVSVAALINCLQESLGDQLKNSRVWDIASLDEAFTKLTAMRYKKVTTAVEASEKAMNMMGWANGYMKALYKVLLPITPNFIQANDATNVIKDGVALRGWELPNVPHTVLYADEERLAKEQRSAVLSPTALLFAATAAAVGGFIVMKATQKHPELLVNSWKGLRFVAV